MIAANPVHHQISQSQSRRIELQNRRQEGEEELDQDQLVKSKVDAIRASLQKQRQQKMMRMRNSKSSSGSSTTKCYSSSDDECGEETNDVVAPLDDHKHKSTSTSTNRGRRITMKKPGQPRSETTSMALPPPDSLQKRRVRRAPNGNRNLSLRSAADVGFELMSTLR